MVTTIISSCEFGDGFSSAVRCSIGFLVAISIILNLARSLLDSKMRLRVSLRRIHRIVKMAPAVVPPTSAIDWSNLKFGLAPTNGHASMVYKEESGWGPIEFVADPYMRTHVGSSGLNYGQSVFEGLKAFRSEDGGVRVFRPDMNAQRINHSADVVSMPPIPKQSYVLSPNPRPRGLVFAKRDPRLSLRGLDRTDAVLSRRFLDCVELAVAKNLEFVRESNLRFPFFSDQISVLLRCDADDCCKQPLTEEDHSTSDRSTSPPVLTLPHLPSSPTNPSSSPRSHPHPRSTDGVHPRSLRHAHRIPLRQRLRHARRGCFCDRYF